MLQNFCALSDSCTSDILPQHRTLSAAAHRVGYWPLLRNAAPFFATPWHDYSRGASVHKSSKQISLHISELTVTMLTPCLQASIASRSRIVKCPIMAPEPQLMGASTSAAVAATSLTRRRQLPSQTRLRSVAGCDGQNGGQGGHGSGEPDQVQTHECS